MKIAFLSIALAGALAAMTYSWSTTVNGNIIGSGNSARGVANENKSATIASKIIGNGLKDDQISEIDEAIVAVGSTTERVPATKQ